MKILFFICLFSLAPTLGLAHGIRIDPVEIHVQTEVKQIRVAIQSHVEYWYSYVLKIYPQLPPPNNWSDDLKNKAAAYIGQHFQLFVDGQPLALELVDARYREEPMQVAEAHVFFDVIYPLPPQGEVLSGKAMFFREEWEEWTEEGPEPGEPLEDHEQELTRFRTHLTFTGSKGITHIVRMDSPDFEFPLVDIRATKKDYAGVAFSLGWTETLQGLAFCFFVLAFLLMQPTTKQGGMAFGLFVVIAIVALHGVPPLSSKGASTLPWITVILFSGLNLRSWPRPVWWASIVISAFLWGWIWRSVAGELPVSDEVLLLARVAYFVAALVVGIIIGILARVVMVLYRKRLAVQSESLADKNFAYHTRFASVALIIGSIYKITRVFLEG